MPNTWLSADLHLSHRNIINFGRPFKTIEEHDEAVVTNHNALVKPSDTWVVLGDVVFPQTGFEYLKRMNGIKLLLPGNHERHKLAKYLEIFKDIRGYKEFKEMICSHIPLHPSQYKRFGVNVHGHLHHGRITLPNADCSIPDCRYYCVSLEHTDYKPISLEDLRARIADQKKTYGVLNNLHGIDLEIGGDSGPG